jgi:xanthosine utilization system XapX-like protein
MKLLGVWGVTTGSGYAIRAWSLLQKQAQTISMFNDELMDEVLGRTDGE